MACLFGFSSSIRSRSLGELCLVGQLAVQQLVVGELAAVVENPDFGDTGGKYVYHERVIEFWSGLLLFIVNDYSC